MAELHTDFCNSAAVPCSEINCSICKQMFDSAVKFMEEKFNSAHSPTNNERQYASQIAAAEKLCKVYFDIAASCIGEDQVRKQVAAATSAVS